MIRIQIRYILIKKNFELKSTKLEKPHNQTLTSRQDGKADKRATISNLTV